MFELARVSLNHSEKRTKELVCSAVVAERSMRLFFDPTHT